MALPQECNQLSKSIKLAAAVFIIVIGLALILLVVATLYNYTKKSRSTKVCTKKDKIISYMSIGTTVVIGVGLLVFTWQYSIALRTTAVSLTSSN